MKVASMKTSRLHMKLFSLLLLLFCVPEEAFVSQVHYQGIPHDWEHSLEHAPVIVVARRKGGPQLYKEWIFPREAHYTRSEETIAREWVQAYEILEVVRSASGRPMVLGQEILVWQQPEYGREELEYYHRTGIIHSPMILVKEAAAEIRDGRVLLFLQPHEELWRFYNDAPEEGESLLKQRTTTGFLESDHVPGTQ